MLIKNLKTQVTEILECVCVSLMVALNVLPIVHSSVFGPPWVHLSVLFLLFLIQLVLSALVTNQTAHNGSVIKVSTVSK
jgi:hypothetical protein